MKIDDYNGKYVKPQVIYLKNKLKHPLLIIYTVFFNTISDRSNTSRYS